jgi:hypothetical protein
MHRFYFRSGDFTVAVVFAIGEVAIAASTTPPAFGVPAGFSHEASDINSYTHEVVEKSTTLGFGAVSEANFTGCFIPHWFLTLFWAGLSGLLVWRIIMARRGKISPAFPVDFSDKGEGNAA